MDLFPTSVGTRPRLACEIRPEGIVAARGESSTGMLTAIGRAPLPPGAVLPGLRTGNLPNRPAVVAALRRAFEAIADRSADRSRYITLIVPDLCARVLLLDFDALPSKLADALPIVRFRLKKLLPFEVEHALVSFQVMSTERSLLRVLAVAIPCDVLAEYESAVIEAGLQPGAVLPSTLAALAGLDLQTSTALMLNTAAGSLTTAIVRSGVLLLHRTIDLTPSGTSDAVSLLPRAHAESMDPHPERSSSSELLPEFSDADVAVALLNLAPEVDNRSRDLAESISVAAAYFEDTLATAPRTLLTAGITSSQSLVPVLEQHGLDSLDPRELLGSEALGPGAANVTIAPGLLAGVRGALRS